MVYTSFSWTFLENIWRLYSLIPAAKFWSLGPSVHTVGPNTFFKWEKITESLDGSKIWIVYPTISLFYMRRIFNQLQYIN